MLRSNTHNTFRSSLFSGFSLALELPRLSQFVLRLDGLNLRMSPMTSLVNFVPNTSPVTLDLILLA